MKQSHPSSIFGIIKSISIKNNNTADYSNPLQLRFSTQKSKSVSLYLKHKKETPISFCSDRSLLFQKRRRPTLPSCGQYHRRDRA